MGRKYEIALFATLFAVAFTALSYIDVKRAAMWLSLEIIILPFLYVVGYEMLMDKQKQEADAVVNRLVSKFTAIERENVELKHKLNIIKRIK